MVTVKDIAREANVSHTAVSAVLTGRAKEARIGEATAERIRKIAQKMKYSPNMTARGLRTSKSYSIGILLPTPENNIYNNLLRQLQRKLHQKGYFGIYSFWNTYEDMSAALESVLQRQVDGIITVAPDVIPDPCSVPLISFLVEDKAYKYDYVGLNRKVIFDLIIAYLYSLGHRRIAKPDGSPKSEVDKLFRKTLAKYSLSPDWIFNSYRDNGLYFDTLRAHSAEIVATILAAKERPTAIVMPNDFSAIAFMAEAARGGLRVPQDISVIGADNINICDYVIPSLASVAFEDANKQPADYLIDAIMRRINNPAMPRKVTLIPGRLVIRDSIAKVAKNIKERSL